MSVAENLQKVKSNLPEKVTLVAVSKTKPNEMIEECYNVGHLDFGENKVQDLTKKYEELPKDIRWHFIGHLQTNKVKYIAPFIYLMHGIDSWKLLMTIEKEGTKNNRVINCLLQVKIAKEDSKFGLSTDEVREILNSDEIQTLKHVNVMGLMGMGTRTNDESETAAEFQSLKSLFDELKEAHKLTILSMGMSGDYPLAVENGSNMVRVGSTIFGPRIF